MTSEASIHPTGNVAPRAGPFRRLTDPNLRRMIALVWAHRPILALATVTMAVDASCQGLIAKLTAVLLGHGIIRNDPRFGYWMPLAFIGVFVVRGVANFSSSYLVNVASQNVLVSLRGEMFQRLLHWPQATIENTPSGIVISKFLNEASNALALTAEVLLTAVRESFTTLALLGLLLFDNWRLTLLTVVVGPTIATVLRSIGKRLHRLNRESQAMLGEMTRAVQEAHDAGRIVKVYGGQGYETRRFETINQRLRRFGHSCRFRLRCKMAAHGVPLAQRGPIRHIRSARLKSMGTTVCKTAAAECLV